MLCCQTCGHRKYSPILSLESIAIFTASWYLDVEFLGYLPCYNIFSFFVFFNHCHAARQTLGLSVEKEISLFLLTCNSFCAELIVKLSGSERTPKYVLSLSCVLCYPSPPPPPHHILSEYMILNIQDMIQVFGQATKI